MIGLTREECLAEARRAEAIAKAVSRWVPGPDRQGDRSLATRHLEAIDFWQITAEALKQGADALEDDRR